MRYKVLDRTGLKVSELSFGTLTFGGWEPIGALD
jgi:aryl-alcohol dehydrogenase-like predicted oxidoreductase